MCAVHLPGRHLYPRLRMQAIGLLPQWHDMSTTRFEISWIFVYTFWLNPCTMCLDIWQFPPSLDERQMWTRAQPIWCVKGIEHNISNLCILLNWHLPLLCTYIKWSKRDQWPSWHTNERELFMNYKYPIFNCCPGFSKVSRVNSDMLHLIDMPYFQVKPIYHIYIHMCFWEFIS